MLHLHMAREEASNDLKLLRPIYGKVFESNIQSWKKRYNKTMLTQANNFGDRKWYQ